MEFFIKDSRKDIVAIFDDNRITAISSAIKKVNVNVGDRVFSTLFSSDNNYEIKWIDIQIDNDILYVDYFSEITLLDENDYIIVKITNFFIETHSPSIEYLTIDDEYFDSMLNLKFINNKIEFKDMTAGKYFVK